MNVMVQVEISGDLEHPQARALAEHACRLVADTVRRVGDGIPGASVTIGQPVEAKDELRRRAFAGFERWEDQAATVARKVSVACYLGLPDPAPNR